MEVGFPQSGIKSVAPSALTGAVTILHTGGFTWAKFSGDLTGAVSGVTLATGSISAPGDNDILVMEIPNDSTARAVTCTATSFAKANVVQGIASKTVIATFIAKGGLFYLQSVATQT
jgi:hypothetical protein